MTGRRLLTAYRRLLPCKHVLHAVGPTWRGGQQGEPLLLQMAVRSCLAKAHELKHTSIALPAISSGIFGYPKPRCAQDMFDIVLLYLHEEPKTTLREIRFTNFDEQTCLCFEEVTGARRHFRSVRSRKRPLYSGMQETNQAYLMSFDLAQLLYKLNLLCYIFSWFFSQPRSR
jgi:hypothetical protein